MKILLVDDDLFLRDMYSTKFSSCGHEIETAESSVKVISLLGRGNTYDVALLDMIMPGTNGIELLNIMNKKFPNQVKYSIFLTNQGQDEDIREATEAGAVGYIIKADSVPSEVVKKVEEIVSKQKK
ncbi:MAG: response regulator [Candidatus Nomurabacteria bacterium]|nr:MAG: response regulator [Candidatus Nomurabacteria bacterium]